MNTETRTPDQIARAEAESWLAKNPETVVTALARMIEDTLYLSMKAEWEMEDNFQITEGLSDVFPVPADLTVDEIETAMDYYGLESDDLDSPYAETYDAAHAETEEN